MSDDLFIPDLSPEDDVLKAALKYAAAGWYVGPVKAGTKDPRSTLGKGWPGRTSRDPEVIVSWYAGKPERGVFLHLGRSGAVAFDVDNPDKLPPALTRAVAELKPPYQSSRPDQPGRGHYLFAVPPGRMLGNSLGTLAGGWGDIRGRNGLIIAAPTRHAAGGRYDWPETGPVPALPTYVGEALPDATNAADAATDAQVAAFLAEHTTSARPGLLDIHSAAFANKVAAGESRHHSMTGHLAGAMKEARLGLLDAKLAADTLEVVFLAAVAQTPQGKQGSARTGAQARNEWRGLLAWAVAQAFASDPAEVLARVNEKVDMLGWIKNQAVAGTTAPVATGNESAGETVSPDEQVRLNFPAIDWDELWTGDEGEDWILEPLIPARRLVALYSVPKIGKSLLMLEIAVGVSNGTRTLGVLPDRAYRVLYVDHENDPRGDIRTRLEDMGYGPADLKNLCYLSYPVMDGLDSAIGAQQLLDVVRAYECDLVVIDTISRAVNGDENDNDTWLRMFRLTGKALKRAGIAMIRLDHTGKDDVKGMRGGSAKYGDVDAVWKMTEETATAFKLVCTHHRFQVAEDELVLTRLTQPLRHKVEGGGWAALMDTKFNAAMDALAKADLPADAGRTRARPILKDAGIRIGQAPLGRVLDHRKTCQNLSRTGYDHRTCPDASRTGPDRGLSG